MRLNCLICTLLAAGWLALFGGFARAQGAISNTPAPQNEQLPPDLQPTIACDQPPRKGDALRLVAVEELDTGASLHTVGKLPSEIDGIPDAGVHALAANGTVDMGGIAEQEGAAFAEMPRHPVMDVIGREPVHALDLDVEAVDEAGTDIIGGESVARLGLALDRADEPRPPGALQRKDRQELRLVDHPHEGAGHIDSQRARAIQRKQRGVGRDRQVEFLPCCPQQWRDQA